jgi:hypothetical protein
MRQLILMLTVLFTCGLGSFSLQTANTAASVAMNTDEELVGEKLRLENEKLRRQIRQLDENSRWKDYLATVGGVCTALLFPIVAALWKVRSDRQDRRRVATADFAAAYALAVHAMEWHTWKAANGLCVKPEDVDEYDSEIHKLIPALCGSILKASAYDKQVHLLLKPYFSDVLKQDGQIARENIKLRRGEYKSVDTEKRHEEIMKLWEKISPAGFNLT